MPLIELRRELRSIHKKKSIRSWIYTFRVEFVSLPLIQNGLDYQRKFHAFHKNHRLYVGGVVRAKYT